MNPQIKKARQLLSSMTHVSSKRAFLDELRPEIEAALARKHSIRAIFGKLKEAGFPGSLMLLTNVVKEWKNDRVLTEKETQIIQKTDRNITEIVKVKRQKSDVKTDKIITEIPPPKKRTYRTKEEVQAAKEEAAAMREAKQAARAERVAAAEAKQAAREAKLAAKAAERPKRQERKAKPVSSDINLAAAAKAASAATAEEADPHMWNSGA